MHFMCLIMYACSIISSQPLIDSSGYLQPALIIGTIDKRLARKLGWLCYIRRYVTLSIVWLLKTSRVCELFSIIG